MLGALLARQVTRLGPGPATGLGASRFASAAAFSGRNPLRVRTMHTSSLSTAAAAPSSGKGSTHDEGEERALAAAGADIDAASMRHAPGLFLGWAAASGGAAYAAVNQGVPADLVLLMDTTAWLAVVASISLTEAWVKFRAPLLERWVGVDVGRRVFRAQYAVEAALAGTAGGLLAVQAGSASATLSLLGGGPGALLAGAGAILALELAYVFPALDVRGRQLIASAVRPEGLMSERQRAYVAALRAAVAGKPSPPAQLHLVSVLLAFVKAGLLAGCTWTLLLQQAVQG